MSYLVLDLDETVMVVDSRLSNIHAAHELSIPIRVKAGKNEVNVHIINPVELSDLIEDACIFYDGIIVLTSGYWDKSLINNLAWHLNLSKQAYDKFVTCRFHSVTTDCLLFQLHPYTVHSMDKNSRLNQIIKHFPELNDKYMTILDDNPDHIDSFNDNQKVHAVWANTGEAKKDFYLQANDAMSECRNKEKEATVVSRQTKIDPPKMPPRDLFKLFHPPVVVKNDREEKAKDNFFSYNQ